jgi:hypothetical protein
MICSREEIRRELAAQYYDSGRQEDGAAMQPGHTGRPTFGSRTWSPAVATGFLGLIIVSAMAGIVAILSAIR